MRLALRLPVPMAGGSRFWIAAAASFLATVAVLASAGVTVIELTVRKPPDPFRTGSFEFDLAPGWWCDIEGADYVCNPPGKPPYSAIAIIAIKERGADDNLKAYENYLNQPKQPTVGVSKSASVVAYVERIKLGHAEWVEALHRGSENANYYTYYLATNTSHLGILVTMSFYKEYESKYVRQLKDMMSTLDIYQK